MSDLDPFDRERIEREAHLVRDLEDLGAVHLTPRRAGVGFGAPPRVKVQARPDGGSGFPIDPDEVYDPTARARARRLRRVRA